MQITFDLPDEVVAQLHPLEDKLPQISCDKMVHEELNQARIDQKQTATLLNAKEKSKIFLVWFENAILILLHCTYTPHLKTVYVNICKLISLILLTPLSNTNLT